MIPEQHADVELSKSAAALSFYEFQNKDCYNNAIRYLFGEKSNRYYCVGWAIQGGVGFPMEHAWVETDSGQLIELTPIWFEHVATNRYYAAVKMSRNKTMKYLNKTLWPLFRQEFEAAYWAAQMASFGEEHADTVRGWFPDKFPDGKYQETVGPRLLE
jgi:hypothetical protein